MNRETIEKAANAYIGHEPEWDEGVHVYSERLAFVNGARWRINSVWHDVSKELPDIGKHVVNEDWFDFIADDEKDMERILRLYPFKHWAYIDDLLPDGKEDR